MKKFSKVLVVVCMLAAILISAVACATSGTAGKDDQGRYILNAPEIAITTNVVTWGAVRYAEKYGVVINDKVEDEIVLENKTNFVYDGKLGAGSIKVRAIGDDEISVSGEYSNTVEYTPSATLDTPVIAPIQVSGTDLVLSWSTVTNATSYAIKQSATNEGESAEYNSTTNEYKISLADLAAAGVYSFSIQAISSDNSVIDSGLSDVVRHITEKKIANPIPSYENKNTGSIGVISLEKLDFATHYILFMNKNGGEFEEVSSTTNPVWSSNTIEEKIMYFGNPKGEDDDNWTDKSNGSYTFKVQAVNRDSSSVYPSSDLIDVKLATDVDKIATIKKAAAPTNVALNGDLLTWDKTPGFEDYTIELVSGEHKRTIDVPGASSYSLAVKDEDKSFTAGKVFEIFVRVKEGEDKINLAGLPVKADSVYTYIPTEAPTKLGGDGVYKEYLAINNTGDIAYMLAHPSGKYILNSDIDGSKCNIYGSDAVFTGELIGNGKYIKNMNLISDEKHEIHLFETIAVKAIVRDLSFSNFNVTSEDGLLQVSLIAENNYGTISNVYVVKSNYNIAGSFNGLVGTNHNKIENVGMLYTNIKIVHELDSATELNAVGIAKVNNGDIFNASITNCSISINALDFKDKPATKANTVRDLTVAGIAVVNNGSISYSMVCLSVIKVVYHDTGFVTQATAGGIVAKNESGSIANSYVQGKNSATYTVHIYGQKLNEGSVEIAGAIVAIANNATINSSYFASGQVSATDYSAGIVGFIKNGGVVTINNSFTHGTKFVGENKGYITTAPVSSTINMTNVYFLALVKNSADYFVGDAVVIGATEFASLVDGKIEGYTTNTKTYSNYPVLANMLYVHGDNKVNNVSGEVEDRNESIVYNGTVLLDNVASATLSSVTNMGYYIDKYKITFGEGEGARDIILPIMNEVSGN